MTITNTFLSLARDIGVDKWDIVFKNGPSKICERQTLKNLKGYDLLKQSISLENF